MKLILLAGLALLPFWHNAAASGASIPRIDASANVDGLLLEPFWAEVLAIPLTVEIAPRQLGVAQITTNAKFWHDGKTLYVGVEAKDSAASRIRASSGVRDSWGKSDDHVALMVDSEGRGRRAYTFRINAVGSMADEIRSGVGESASDWNGSWEGAAFRSADGYVVEFAIPLSTLGIRVRAKESVNLKINVERTIGRERRETVSVAPIDRASACEICQLPTYELADVDPVRSAWRISPYVSATIDQRYNPASGDRLSSSSNEDIGLDIAWKPRQGMTVLGTINPDFSQVEIDSIQFSVNKRFALTFPERRPFFTEDPGMFRSNVPLVYTRAITSPEWGLQALNRSENGSWGGLVASDRFTSLILPGLDSSRTVSLDSPSNNLVARYENGLSNELSLGALVTSRRADGYQNDVASFDGRWRMTKRSQVTWQLGLSETRNPAVWQTRYDLAKAQSGYVLDLRYSYTGEVYSNSFSVQQVSEDFRADLGTVNQVGVAKFVHNSSWTWVGEPDELIASKNLSFGASQTDAMDGGLLRRSAGLYGGTELSNGWSADVGGNVSEESFEGKTHQLSDISLSIFGEVSDQLILVPVVSWAEGIDYEFNQVGEYLTLSLGGSYRPTKEWRFSPSLVHDRFTVDGFGLRFATRAFRLKTVWSPKADHQLSFVVNVAEVDVVDAVTRVEFNSDEIQGQLVYNWRPGPFTALYLGYSGRGQGGTAIGPTGRASDYFFAKLVLEL